MNTAAQKHLAKAQGYLAKGDTWYAKAADEIIAAQKADPTLSNREIGAQFGRSKSWAQNIVAWRTSDQPDGPVNWSRGSHATTQEVRDGVRRVLQTASAEEVADLMQDVTPEQRDEILIGIQGTDEERKVRREENVRRDIAQNPMNGWRVIGDGLGESNLGLHHVLDAFTKLAINAEINPDHDFLRVAHSRAAQLGRSIHEVEMAWGETPITDKIEELRRTSAEV